MARDGIDDGIGKTLTLHTRCPSAGQPRASVTVLLDPCVQITGRTSDEGRLPKLFHVPSGNNHTPSRIVILSGDFDPTSREIPQNTTA